jgi:hypothetical protein
MKVSARSIDYFRRYLKAGTTADTRKAVVKLERIAALAATSALTIKAARR